MYKIQLEVTEMQLAFLRELLQSWEENTFAAPTHYTMNEIYELKDQLDQKYKDIHGMPLSREEHKQVVSFRDLPKEDQQTLLDYLRGGVPNNTPIRVLKSKEQIINEMVGVEERGRTSWERTKGERS